MCGAIERAVEHLTFASTRGLQRGEKECQSLEDRQKRHSREGEQGLTSYPAGTIELPPWCSTPPKRVPAPAPFPVESHPIICGEVPQVAGCGKGLYFCTGWICLRGRSAYNRVRVGIGTVAQIHR